MQRILALMAAFFLAGCANTVSTRMLAPCSIPPPNRLADVPKNFAELSRWAGSDSERLALAARAVLSRTPRSGKDAGADLLAAGLAQRSLETSKIPPRNWLTNPQTSETLGLANTALARFIKARTELIRRNGEETCATPVGPVEVVVRYDRDLLDRVNYYDRWLIADQVAIRGFQNRITVKGVGVPLVALRKTTPGRALKMVHFPETGVASPLTATIEFANVPQPRAVIRVLDPLNQSQVKIAGAKLPLAADFTAPLAFSFGGVNDLMLGIRNLLNVRIGEEDAGIYLTEPMDPNRIPVLLIHGLSSSPVVWRNVVNEAMADPLIRKRFQFWYAYYSTGAPIIASAAELREDISEIRTGHPQAVEAKKFVVVGYSMGGVIAQILITDIKNRLWDTISRVPFDQVKFDPDDVADIRASIFWKPVPDINQVIFIATPHRGTRMADASFARLADSLIRLPGSALQFQNRFFSALSDSLEGQSTIPSRITGLNSLSANSPLYRAMEGVPFEKGVMSYSIIGDRGRGDSPDSSDGVVGYWSSHLEGAASELIVPTGHDAQASPLAEAEIQRILRLDTRTK